MKSRQQYAQELLDNAEGYNELIDDSRALLEEANPAQAEVIMGDLNTLRTSLQNQIAEINDEFGMGNIDAETKTRMNDAIGPLSNKLKTAMHLASWKALPTVLTTYKNALVTLAEEFEVAESTGDRRETGNLKQDVANMLSSIDRLTKNLELAPAPDTALSAGQLAELREVIARLQAMRMQNAAINTRAAGLDSGTVELDDLRRNPIVAPDEAPPAEQAPLSPPQQLAEAITAKLRTLTPTELTAFSEAAANQIAGFVPGQFEQAIRLVGLNDIFDNNAYARINLPVNYIARLKEISDHAIRVLETRATTLTAAIIEILPDLNAEQLQAILTATNKPYAPRQLENDLRDAATGMQPVMNRVNGNVVLSPANITSIKTAAEAAQVALTARLAATLDQQTVLAADINTEMDTRNDAQLVVIKAAANQVPYVAGKFETDIRAQGVDEILDRNPGVQLNQAQLNAVVTRVNEIQATRARALGEQLAFVRSIKDALKNLNSTQLDSLIGATTSVELTRALAITDLQTIADTYAAVELKPEQVLSISTAAGREKGEKIRTAANQANLIQAIKDALPLRNATELQALLAATQTPNDATFAASLNTAGLAPVTARFRGVNLTNTQIASLQTDIQNAIATPSTESQQALMRAIETDIPNRNAAQLRAIITAATTPYARGNFEAELSNAADATGMRNIITNVQHQGVQLTNPQRQSIAAMANRAANTQQEVLVTALRTQVGAANASQLREIIASMPAAYSAGVYEAALNANANTGLQATLTAHPGVQLTQVQITNVNNIAETALTSKRDALAEAVRNRLPRLSAANLLALATEVNKPYVAGSLETVLLNTPAIGLQDVMALHPGVQLTDPQIRALAPLVAAASVTTSTLNKQQALIAAINSKNDSTPSQLRTIIAAARVAPYNAANFIAAMNTPGTGLQAIMNDVAHHGVELTAEQVSTLATTTEQRLTLLMADRDVVDAQLALSHDIQERIATLNAGQLEVIRAETDTALTTAPFQHGAFEAAINVAATGLQPVFAGGAHAGVELTQEQIRGLLHPVITARRQLELNTLGYDYSNIGFPRNANTNDALYKMLSAHQAAGLIADDTLAEILTLMSKATNAADLTAQVQRITAAAAPPAVVIEPALLNELLAENKRRPANFKPVTKYFGAEQRRAQEAEFLHMKNNEWRSRYADLAENAQLRTSALKHETESKSERQQYALLVPELTDKLTKYKYFLHTVLFDLANNPNSNYRNMNDLEGNNAIEKVKAHLADNQKMLDNLAIAATNLQDLRQSRNAATERRAFFSNTDKLSEVCQTLEEATAKAQAHLRNGGNGNPIAVDFGNVRQNTTETNYTYRVHYFNTSTTPDPAAQIQNVPVAAIEKLSPSKDHLRMTIVGYDPRVSIDTTRELAAKLVQTGMASVKLGPVRVSNGWDPKLALAVMAYCDYKGITCIAPAAIQKMFKPSLTTDLRTQWKNDFPTDLGVKEIRELSEKAKIPVPTHRPGR
jgi:hypothetical protein